MNPVKEVYPIDFLRETFPALVEKFSYDTSLYTVRENVHLPSIEESK